MKYFKVPTTQAITNTCNNINWNEFSGCSRLKLSDRRGGVAAHFDTGPPRPPLPTPTNSSLPHLRLVLGPVWQQLASTGWCKSPWARTSCGSARSSHHAAGTVSAVDFCWELPKKFSTPPKWSRSSHTPLWCCFGPRCRGYSLFPLCPML